MKYTEMTQPVVEIFHGLIFIHRYLLPTNFTRDGAFYEY